MIADGETVLPIEPATSAGVGTWRLRAARAGLETDHPADTATLTSFLVNALYLFGGQTLAIADDVPEEVTAELTRLGHRVRRRSGGALVDRVFLAEIFGGGNGGESDEAILAVFSHEMFEINALRKRFALHQTIDGIKIVELIRSGNRGNLHDQAWDHADVLVQELRQERRSRGGRDDAR